MFLLLNKYSEAEPLYFYLFSQCQCDCDMEWGCPFIYLNTFMHSSKFSLKENLNRAQVERFRNHVKLRLPSLSEDSLMLIPCKFWESLKRKEEAWSWFCAFLLASKSIDITKHHHYHLSFVPMPTSIHILSIPLPLNFENWESFTNISSHSHHTTPKGTMLNHALVEVLI